MAGAASVMAGAFESATARWKRKGFGDIAPEPARALDFACHSGDVLACIARADAALGTCGAVVVRVGEAEPAWARQGMDGRGRPAPLMVRIGEVITECHIVPKWWRDSASSARMHVVVLGVIDRRAFDAVREWHEAFGV